MFHNILLVVHLLSIALAVGTLVTQSLMLVLRSQLDSQEHIDVFQKIQKKAHLFIYHPSIGFAILSGLTLAMQTGAFTNGKWLHWKLMFVFLLVGVGVVTGVQIKKDKGGKALRLVMHIGVLSLATIIIYFASIKPF